MADLQDFEKEGKLSKKKRSNFKPNREFVRLEQEEYLQKGGKITQITIDDIRNAPIELIGHQSTIKGGARGGRAIKDYHGNVIVEYGTII
jgi:hypothetical protein